MVKLIGVATALLMIPGIVFAQNVGKCGWGSKLFDGQGGIAPQVLAVTTNGTSGNQTFAISSGTSGCTQDGVVRSNWKTAAFIDSNMNKLARDVSQGEGETLKSLASLLQVAEQDQEHFNSTLKQNFAKVFPSHEASTEDVLASLKDVLASDATLAAYSARV